MKRALLNLILPVLLLGGVSLAQETEPEDGQGRGVARLSLLGGDVSVKRGDSGDWVAAAVNAPVLAEDRVVTGPGARAEIQFDYYHRIRLAQDTEVRLTQLDNQMYQMQVARGTVTFAAIQGGDAQVEISIPGAAVRPVAYGNYRVSVYPDGTADISVRSGEAEVFTPSGSEILRGGRTMRVRLVGSNESEYQFIAALPRDPWDEFNERRDKELRSGEQVYQYVSRDVYGAEDLNGQGDWVNVAPYGYSWRPYAAADWTPYRNGRWTWADYYGWTWVSYDPWGWAPYHYGRWFNSGGRWCWYPGAANGMRHHWSPALVGWVGWDSWGGFNAGVGFGWGAVGWVPLAPFEPMHRWWGSGWYNGYRGGRNNTSIINNVNITNVYRNSRVNNGVTVVNGNDFRRGEFGRTLRVTNEDFGRANMARGMLPVAPARESLRMSGRDAVMSNISNRAASAAPERFYSRREVPRANRVSFDDQRRSMERVASRGVGGPVGGVESLRGGGVSNAPRSGAAEGGGWRRVGEGVTSQQNGTAQSTPASGNSSWQRFGDPGMGSRSGSDSGRQTTAPADSSSRTGWRSFGDPSNTTRTGEQPRTVEPSRQGSSQAQSPRVERSVAPSTGGGNRVERSAPSTGGGGGRSETPRSAPGTGGGNGGGRSEPARSNGRGNSFAEPMSRGGWSTGGGSGYETRSMPSPSRSYEAPRGGFSSGGGFGGGGGIRSSGSSNGGGSLSSGGGGGSRMSNGGGNRSGSSGGNRGGSSGGNRGGGRGH